MFLNVIFKVNVKLLVNFAKPMHIIIIIPNTTSHLNCRLEDPSK